MKKAIQTLAGLLVLASSQPVLADEGTRLERRIAELRQVRLALLPADEIAETTLNSAGLMNMLIRMDRSAFGSPVTDRNVAQVISIRRRLCEGDQAEIRRFDAAVDRAVDVFASTHVGLLLTDLQMSSWAVCREEAMEGLSEHLASIRFIGRARSLSASLKRVHSALEELTSEAKASQNVAVTSRMTRTLDAPLVGSYSTRRTPGQGSTSAH